MWCEMQVKDTRSCRALEEYVKDNCYSRFNLQLLMLQRNTLSYLTPHKNLHSRQVVKCGAMALDQSGSSRTCQG